MNQERRLSIYDSLEIYNKIGPDSYVQARRSGPLSGEVEVSGTKNMVSKVVALALSGDGSKVEIANAPGVGDLGITLDLCTGLGIRHSQLPNNNLLLDLSGLKDSVAIYSENTNRVAILMAGPLLSKFGEARVGKPGGCNIGERKVDYHLRGLETFGVAVFENPNDYYLKLRNECLRPSSFRLPFPSVGATENMLITASCVEGESFFENCALEPEIMELIKILQSSGVAIKISPPNNIWVKGGKHCFDQTIKIIPDRIEAGSLGIAAITTEGDVFVRGAQQEPLLTFLSCIQQAGGGVEIFEDGIRFFYKQPLKNTGIITEVHPGFPTDLQQPMALLMSQAKGKSQIHETVFENRFSYFDQLNNIAVGEKKPFQKETDCPKNSPCRFFHQGHEHVGRIEGPVNFGQGDLVVTDLRAGFALLNAAVLSEGVKVRDLKALYRGYEDPVAKLVSLGADIELCLRGDSPELSDNKPSNS